MAWRRHSYSGAPAPAAQPAAPLPPLPFPGMQPHSLLGSPLGDGAASLFPTPGPTPQAAPSLQPLPRPDPAAAATATADEEQLQSMLSALRVALAKKEGALVSVAGQLAEAQGRLEGAEAERRGLATRVRELEAAGAAPGPLAAAASVTAEGRLLAQARQELGREAAAAAELAAERDALRRDVALLQQQLMAAAQAEAQERERLAAEAAQSRLLARARARQVQQLQAELAAAASSAGGTAAAASQHVDAARGEAAAAARVAAEANARAAAVEAEAAQLRQQLEAAQQACRDAESRASAAEREAAEAAQQGEWQALRIGELEAASSVGQLMRKYEGEVQRLRAQFEAEHHELRRQLAQARQQAADAAAAAPATQATAPAHHQGAGLPQQASQDSAAWAALFDQPEASQQAAPQVQEVGVQTQEGGSPSHQPTEEWVDPVLLEAARLEVERLQHVAAQLLESQTAAQRALQDALAQQRDAQLARDSEAAARAAAASKHPVALDAARRAEAGLRERLRMAERQVERQDGEVRALREANEKLDLALAALREELEAALQAPHPQLEQLHAELRQAAAHTDALEAQMKQLKQQAAAAAEGHAAAVRQQAQEGALDAAEQVAAAVQAAAERHSQEVQALQRQLTDAHCEAQAAQAELAALQEDQATRQGRMMEAGVQAGSPTAAAQHSAVQTEAAAEPLPSLPLLPAAPRMLQRHQHPSRGGSACESPPLASGGCGSRSPAPLPAASVAQTAKQLQLELARVKLTPLKPLLGASLAAGASATRHPQPPSRLGSALGELGGTAFGAAALQLGGGGSSLDLASQRQVSGLPWRSSGSYSRLAGEDEDACWATPLAQTPASLSPELSPCGSMLPPATTDGGPSRQGGLLHHELQRQQQAWAPQQEQQQERQEQWAEQRPRQGAPVPPLDLQLVRPYTSLSCDSSGREHRPLCGSAGGGSSGDSGEAASASVCSLSTLGPSASQLGVSWTPAAGGGSCGGLLAPAASQRHGSGSGRSPGTECGLGCSWQSAALDASLARLAALTAGLTGSSSRQRE